MKAYDYVSLAICFIAPGNHSFHFMDFILILINFNLFFCEHCLAHVNYIVLSGNFQHLICFEHLVDEVSHSCQTSTETEFSWM